VLGQYGLLFAQQHDELISKLVILNTPVDLKSALRPELAAYKNPISFLRPKADKRFDAMTYNASGLAYAIQYRDAQAYAAPYEEPSTSAAASAVVYHTMEQVCANADRPVCRLHPAGSHHVWSGSAAGLEGTAERSG